MTKARPIFTAEFWLDAGERAISTAAQAAVGAIGVEVLVPIAELDPAIIGGIAASAALLSVLKSVAASAFGDGSASAVK